jgi:hypothetical protein
MLVDERERAWDITGIGRHQKTDDPGMHDAPDVTVSLFLQPEIIPTPPEQQCYALLPSRNWVEVA